MQNLDHLWAGEQPRCLLLLLPLFRRWRAQSDVLWNPVGLLWCTELRDGVTAASLCLHLQVCLCAPAEGSGWAVDASSWTVPCSVSLPWCSDNEVNKNCVDFCIYTCDLLLILETGGVLATHTEVFFWSSTKDCRWIFGLISRYRIYSVLS